MTRPIKSFQKPASVLEVVFRCLAVAVFFFFIFFVVPRLGQHCKTAVQGNLKTLDDLQTFLLQLAEEYVHDADKSKHMLSLAQQVGGASALSQARSGEGKGQQPPFNTSASDSQSDQSAPGDLAQQLKKSQADLAAAKLVIRRHEQLLQQQLAESARLRSQLEELHLQRPSAAITHTDASEQRMMACESEVVRAFAVAGDSCEALPGVELGGDVVVWGSEHKTSTAAECCAACLAHSRAISRGVGSAAGKNGQPCTTWVHCNSAARCGRRYQECWLKHDAHAATSAAAAASAAATAADSMWTSGLALPGHALAPWKAQQLGLPAAAAAAAAAVDSSVASGVPPPPAPALLWSTALGTIRVQLLPELAPGSVRELTRMAALLAVTSGGRCSNCRIYRAEPGFLVQGILEAPGAYVAVPRQPNPPQRKVMQRGLMCWAGGGGGPDWFVNLIDQAGFGDQHLCFGQTDAAGLAVFEAVARLPVKPKGGAASVEMLLLQEDVRFNVTIDHGV